jgi:hypothetical protein
MNPSEKCMMCSDSCLKCINERKCVKCDIKMPILRKDIDYADCIPTSSMVGFFKTGNGQCVNC